VGVDRKATVRRLIDEVYFFGFDGARIATVWGVEDTLDRFRQLGLERGAT
jgi:hypothetical protein